MEETREIILSLYVKHSWLNSIHYHVGSQGITIDMFVKAANICVGFVKEIEIANLKILADDQHWRRPCNILHITRGA